MKTRKRRRAAVMKMRKRRGVVTKMRMRGAVGMEMRKRLVGMMKSQSWGTVERRRRERSGGRIAL